MGLLAQENLAIFRYIMERVFQPSGHWDETYPIEDSTGNKLLTKDSAGKSPVTTGLAISQ